MIEPCNRRGSELRPGYFGCSSNRIMHPEPGIVHLDTCGICPYRNLPDHEGVPQPQIDPRLYAACQHRGEVIEAAVCNVCGFVGQPFDVFACQKHGRCMTRRFRNDRPELKVCLTCEDFTAAEAQATIAEP